MTCGPYTGSASRERLDYLLQTLVRVLPGLPGFRRLSLFGSVAEGRADGYSDLDMILKTDDLAASKAHLLGLLEEEIGPVEFALVLPLRPDEWLPMVVFRDEGYYHRLEIGLLTEGAEDPTIPDAQTKLLVEGGPAGLDRVSVEGQAYVPEGGCGHFLLGQFFGGGIRYAKARKRGQATLCYSFVEAAVDWCMRACYAQLSGNYALEARLSRDNYKALDALLTEEQKASILQAVDFSTPAVMDRSAYVTLRKLLEHCSAIAQAQGEVLPCEVFERILQFVEGELGLVAL